MECLKGLKLMPDSSVDLIITDPPYNVDYNKKSAMLQKTGRSRAKQVERDAHFKDSFLDYKKWCAEIFRVLKDNSHAYIFCADAQISFWKKFMVQAGFKFRNTLIWVKNRQGLDVTHGLKYAYRSEFCLFFNKGVKKLNKLGLNNILKFKCCSCNIHPTQKPIDLLRFLIINSSIHGDLILDSFMGSGSTAVACIDSGRNYVGFELSEHYWIESLKRLKKSDNQIRIF